MQRIEDLTTPPEVGRYYLVPTVRGEWYGETRDWPVLGPRHSDAQCLDFDHQHYHFDARFMPANGYEEREKYFWRDVFAAPLTTNPKLNPDGLPAPVWHRRKCKRTGNPFLQQMHEIASTHKNWHCHFDMWTGKQARRDGRGWICPHRSVPLANQPVVDGVVTCPLHLLRIDIATGTVLPPIAADRQPGDVARPAGAPTAREADR